MAVVCAVVAVTAVVDYEVNINAVSAMEWKLYLKIQFALAKKHIHKELRDF